MLELLIVKKILFSALILSSLLGGFALAQSPEPVQEERFEIVFFWSQGCPHCAAEKTFLAELQERYPEIEIKQYEFSENIDLVRKFYRDYGVMSQEQGFVPLTFTPERYFVGFNEQIGKEIEECMQICMGGKTDTAIQGIKIPLFGEINPVSIPIPALAVILGFLDGFNICSLGALVLILSLVLALRSKKRILIFGGIFIVTTVLVYGLLVFLWHQLFVFIAPSIKRIELLIGFLALIGTVYFFREFLRNKWGKAVCRFGGIPEKLSKKVQKMFTKKTGILALCGAVLLFAAAVTIIEFPCTAFFPVLFAGILTEASVSFPLSLFYIGIYILFYMLDEIAVLLIAALTFKIWVASPKSVMFLNLFTSLLLFLLSLYYFFNLF